MLKACGAVLIAFAFFTFGDKAAKIKRRRLDFLEGMLAALSEFKVAVELFSLAVPRALAKSGMEEIKDNAESAKAMNKEDEKDFEIFIKGLKAETLSGQLVNVEAYEKKLKIEETYEREKYRKEEKLLRGGFVLLGFLTVIMLL